MSTLQRSASSSEDLLRMAHVARATLEDTGLVIKHQTRLSSTQGSFCCTPVSFNSTEGGTPSVVPYEDILAVRELESTQSSMTGKVYSLTFAQRRNDHLIPVTLSLAIDSHGDDVVETIYARAYPGTTPKKRVMVILNPHGGKGTALEMFLKKAKPILDAAKYEIDVVKTQKFRHAIAIAREMDIEKYDVVACASGDGVPYEVFNGFYQRVDRARALNKIAVTQLPCGSGNAMSNSCHGTNEPSFAALSLVKSRVANIDLMAVTQHDKTTLSFLSQTFGVIADADIGTEYLRFLGAIRFDIGVLYGILAKKTYPVDIFIKYLSKRKDDVRVHYDENARSVNEKNGAEITEKNLTLKYDANAPVPEDWERVDPNYTNNMSLFYTGKMPIISKSVNFFPASLPNDGAIDLVMMNASIPLMKKLSIMTQVDSGKHVDSPDVIHSKILAYRLKPRVERGYFSVDGEDYPFEETQVEVLVGAAKTLAKNGTYVETGF